MKQCLGIQFLIVNNVEHWGRVNRSQHLDKMIVIVLVKVVNFVVVKGRQIHKVQLCYIIQTYRFFPTDVWLASLAQLTIQ